MVMTLSKTIIYSSDAAVRQYLSQKPELNVIDEYGYTPLVQTAICNSASKAKLLLDAGAEIDFRDLTGRTALHWAADNNNVELCQLLLKYGSDPNAYTLAGQPILVMPFLRNQENVKTLLYEYGASVQFAQDFINTKLIGHRFDLEGRVDLVDTHNTFFEIEFEGFYHEFSIAMIVRSLIDFKYNFGGRKLRKFFPTLEMVIQSLQNALELIQYQHYLVDKKKHLTRINQLLQSPLLILPVSYSGHAIALIKFGHCLVRCDRGEYGRKNGTVIFYELKNPKALNLNVMKYLLYKRQHREFIDDSLASELDAEPMFTLPLPPQISGNCSWANLEATVLAVIFLLLSNKLQKEDLPKANSAYQKQAFEFYEEWKQWDKDRALYFCLQSFYRSSDPAHQASRAAVLAAILFQQCRYEKPNDQIQADRILRIIADPKFIYILKSYLKVFSEDKTNQQFKNLIQFLDDYGMDWEELIR